MSDASRCIDLPAVMIQEAKNKRSTRSEVQSRLHVLQSTHTVATIKGLEKAGGMLNLTSRLR